MPLLADKPLRSKVGKVDRPAGKSGLRVALESLTQDAHSIRCRAVKNELA